MHASASSNVTEQFLSESVQTVCRVRFGLLFPLFHFLYSMIVDAQSRLSAFWCVFGTFRACSHSFTWSHLSINLAYSTSTTHDGKQIMNQSTVEHALESLILKTDLLMRLSCLVCQNVSLPPRSQSWTLTTTKQGVSTAWYGSTPLCSLLFAGHFLVFAGVDSASSA